MKKFKFRLERILNYRNINKQEHLRALMLKNQTLYEHEQNLDELQQAEGRKILNSKEPMSAAWVNLIGAYGKALQMQIVQEREDVQVAREAAEKALAEYIESAKEARALEMLKEKKLREYREILDNEERKFLDDVANIRSNQRINEVEI